MPQPPAQKDWGGGIGGGGLDWMEVRGTEDGTREELVEGTRELGEGEEKKPGGLT